MRGWALIKFSPFSTSVVCIFCNKTVNVITKREDVTKQGFCKTLRRKLRLRGSLLLVLIPFLGVGAYLSLSGSGREVGCGGGGRLFEARRLLLFSAFRMGANWRWALIGGWAPTRINTVSNNSISRKGPLISLAGLTGIISSLILVLIDETRHDRYPL